MTDTDDNAHDDSHDSTGFDKQFWNFRPFEPEDIQQYHDEGLSPTEIAEQVEASIGVVENSFAKLGLDTEASDESSDQPAESGETATTATELPIETIFTETNARVSELDWREGSDGVLYALQRRRGVAESLVFRVDSSAGTVEQVEMDTSEIASLRSIDGGSQLTLD
jgi:hypothetical protein